MGLRLSAGALRGLGAAVTAVLLAAGGVVGADGLAVAGAVCSPTPSYDVTVPTPTGPPSLSTSVDTGGAPYVNVSVLGADAKAYFYSSVFGTTADEVSALTCYGSLGFGKPAFVSNSSRAQYFVVANPSHSVLARQFLPSGSDSGWQDLSMSPLSGVDAIQNGARTDIFYVANNGVHDIVHSWQTAIGGAWSTESLGGGSNFRPSVTRGSDGRLHVWVTGTNGSVYYDAGNTGSWTGWTKITTGASNFGPAAVVGYEASNSREDVFISGTTGGLYQGTFTNLGSFTGWHRIVDVPATEVSAATQGTGTIIVGMNTSAGDTVTTQWFSGVGAWLDPTYLMTYLCDFCLPDPPALAPSQPSQSVDPAGRSYPHAAHLPSNQDCHGSAGRRGFQDPAGDRRTAVNPLRNRGGGRPGGLAGRALAASWSAPVRPCDPSLRRSPAGTCPPPQTCVRTGSHVSVCRHAVPRVVPSLYMGDAL